MGAAPRPTEQLAHLVDEAAGDRQPDELLVGLLDPGALVVRVGVQLDVDLLDRQRRHGDAQVDDHVVHRHRVGVVGQVQPGRLLVAHRTAQHEVVEAAAVGRTMYGALVDQLQVVAVGVGEDVVEEGRHPGP